MEIIMRSVPSSEIRHDQVGDWEYKDGFLFTWVADNISEESQLAVLIHELIESYLCRKHGVTDKQVCEFDKMFEDERRCGHWKDEEPGDDPRSPYREQHQAANHVERAVCVALGITWENHCDMSL